MKYLCLAYGDEKDWKALTKSEQDALLAQDEVLRKRGDLVAPVRPTVTTVRVWDDTLSTTDGTFADSPLRSPDSASLKRPTSTRRFSWCAVAL